VSQLTIEADGMGSVTVDALRFTDGKARIALFVEDDDSSGSVNLDAKGARALAAQLVLLADQLGVTP
jgi:hypothetical protein